MNRFEISIPREWLYPLPSQPRTLHLSLGQTSLPLPLLSSIPLSYSLEDGEKEDKAKEEEQAEYLWAEVTKKKKRRRGQKVEKPEAFMANFFKGLEIYQTKLLVNTSFLLSFLV